MILKAAGRRMIRQSAELGADQSGKMCDETFGYCYRVCRLFDRSDSIGISKVIRN